METKYTSDDNSNFRNERMVNVMLNARWMRALLALGVLFGVFAVMIGGGSASANALAMDLVPPGTKMTSASGAGYAAAPAGPVDMGMGRTATYVPTVPDPLNMNAGIDRQVDELNTVVKPDADGVRRAGGFSAGGIALYKWAQQTNASDGPVELYINGSPNGPGTLGEIFPDTGFIDFNEGGLPSHVTLHAGALRNDGYASCRNQLSSLVTCPVGILIGHYCAVEQWVPGQCYSSFNGPTTTVQVAPNVELTVGETRNPVAVGGEALGRMVDPNFSMPAPVEQALEQVFPQGDPGRPVEGITPRDILQPQGGAPALPNIGELLAPVEQLVEQFTQHPVAPVQPQAKEIPLEVPVNNPVAEAAAPVIEALPAEWQAPAAALVEQFTTPAPAPIPDYVPEAWVEETLPQAPAYVPPSFDAAPAQVDIVDMAADAAAGAGVPQDLVTQGTALVNGFLGVR